MNNSRILAVVLFFAITSCSDDFLNLAPPSNANVENFYRSSADFNAAVMASYSALQSSSQYSSNFFTLMCYRADNLETGSTTSPRHFVDAFNVSTNNTEVDNTWESIFNTIFRCNMILDRIGDASFDEVLRRQYRGEASFIRALIYFNAVRLWGELPLAHYVVSATEAAAIGRSPVSEVYALIEADLVQAAEDLPESWPTEEAGRATSWAAKSLLGKVYLTREKWTDAATVLKDVIDHGPHTLVPSLEDLFSTENENNAEMVFVIKYTSGGIGEGHGLWFSGPLGGSIDLRADLLDAYSPDDGRLAMLDLVPEGSAQVVRKYHDNLSANEAGNDFPVIRYADVLLMYAEALNETGYSPDGLAFTYLNEVRERAGVPVLTSAEITSQQSFREAIQLERRLEFPLENHRWFDLLRTGTAIDVMNSTTDFAGELYQITNNDLLYPVPQSEIDRINKPELFYQNPGY